jgi:hypothetical protein
MRRRASDRSSNGKQHNASRQIGSPADQLSLSGMLRLAIFSPRFVLLSVILIAGACRLAATDRIFGASAPNLLAPCVDRQRMSI